MLSTYRRFYHLSQPAAERFQQPLAEERILISIATTGALGGLLLPAINSTQWADVLKLSFHDSDGPGTSHRGISLTPEQELKLQHFTTADAEAIVEFARKHESTIKNVYVHCAAGISRSAGVAKALMEIYQMESLNRELANYHSYNRFVYRGIIEAAFNRKLGKFKEE